MWFFCKLKKKKKGSCKWMNFKLELGFFFNFKRNGVQKPFCTLLLSWNQDYSALERGWEGRGREVHWWKLQQFNFSILWDILNIKYSSNMTHWSLSYPQWTSTVFPWFVGRLLYNWSFCERKITLIFPLLWYPHSILLNLFLFGYHKPILWINYFFSVRKGVLYKDLGKKICENNC